MSFSIFWIDPILGFEILSTVLKIFLLGAVDHGRSSLIAIPNWRVRFLIGGYLFTLLELLFQFGKISLSGSIIHHISLLGFELGMNLTSKIDGVYEFMIMPHTLAISYTDSMLWLLNLFFFGCLELQLIMSCFCMLNLSFCDSLCGLSEEVWIFWENMGVMSRRVVPACGSLCFFCPSMRARSRQPVKRYKKFLADIFPRNQVSFHNVAPLKQVFACKVEIFVSCQS